MRDENTRELDEIPVVTEGMGGAGGGDLDDVGDVGYPRRAAERGSATLRELREGMGGAGGGDLDDVGDVAAPDRLRDSERIAGESGVVTGITTGVDTDDATDDPSALWENLDDALRESGREGIDQPS